MLACCKGNNKIHVGFRVKFEWGIGGLKWE
jgi:hypothetical protein